MATSAYFSVQLPSSLTDEQFVRVFEWAKQNCLESNVIRESDGGMLLIAQRADERDTRNRQRLMLTNYKNWGIDTTKQPKGWLKILSKDEYDAMQTPAAEPEEAVETPHQVGRNKSEPEDRCVPRRCWAQLTLPKNMLTDPAFLVAAR